MDFPFGFGQKSSLLLIFFFHGLVFSFLSLYRGIRDRHAAGKWLSLLLFLYAMYIAPYMLGYAGWYSQRVTREILFFVPFMQVLLIGPVVYFYTKSLLNNSYRLSRKDFVHFVPALLYFIYSLIVFVTDKWMLDEFYFYADGRDKDLANWYQAMGLLSMACYLIASLRHYARYKTLVYDIVSYAETILFKWIRNFAIAFLGILILRVVFFITNPDWGEFGSQFWHYIAFSFLFYYISINGYTNLVKTTTLGNEEIAGVNVFGEKIPEPLLESKGDLTGEDLEAWKNRLSQLMMESRVFENPKLTLAQVAEELDTNPKIISSAVNKGFAMNFNDFVNHHRIEAIKDKLNAGEHKTTTLLGIALDCGFNSKATFNRAFKKSTSLSPKDYLEKIS